MTAVFDDGIVVGEGFGRERIAAMGELQEYGGLMTPTKRPAGYEDLLAAPEHLVAEIIGGELITSARPRPQHADAALGLAAPLRAAFDRGGSGPGGWRILMEPELHFRGDVLVPDIAGWRRERLPELPAEAWFSLAPDWVCEVLSPATAAHDRAAKLPVYARERVSCAWLVDPIAHRVEVLRRERDAWLMVAAFAGRDVMRADPFSAIAIDLGLLWGEPSSSPTGRD